MKSETWKTFYTSIAGIEYAVSDYGRIKNITKNRLVKPSICRHVNRVYYWAQFRRDGRTFKVSRLVAEKFVPNPENKSWVDHINHDPLDNRACNLRWCTPLENQRNIISVGDVLKKLSEHFSIQQIAEYTGLTVQQIGLYLCEKKADVRSRYMDTYTKCEALDLGES